MTSISLAETGSLIKYETPQLISTQEHKQLPSPKPKHQAVSQIKPNTSAKQNESLKAFLPPKQLIINGELWIQEVSPTPSTTIDVINLQASLESKIIQKGARNDGICPIREELYNQCFDEIIRQVAIQCHARGLLLSRARDELIENKKSYKALYESTLAYGIRKELKAESEMKITKTKEKSLNEECIELAKKVLALENEITLIEQKREEEKKVLQQKHSKEIEQIRANMEEIRESLKVTAFFNTVRNKKSN